jgi:hypothetical protein
MAGLVEPGCNARREAIEGNNEGWIASSLRSSQRRAENTDLALKRSRCGFVITRQGNDWRNNV